MDKQLQKCTVEYKGRKNELSEMTDMFYSNINKICIVHKNRQCVMIIIQSRQDLPEYNPQHQG